MSRGAPQLMVFAEAVWTDENSIIRSPLSARDAELCNYYVSDHISAYVSLPGQATGDTGTFKIRTIASLASTDLCHPVNVLGHTRTYAGKDSRSQTSSDSLK